MKCKVPSDLSYSEQDTLKKKKILAGLMLSTFFTEQSLKDYELVMESPFALSYLQLYYSDT